MAGILGYLAGIDDPGVVVFGITGKQGQSTTRVMTGYGTRVLAGVTPGKGGQDVDGIPVFDSCADAVSAVPGLNSAVFFVPAGAVLGATREAAAAGIRFMVHTADGVATHDAALMREMSVTGGFRIVGPNTVGMLDTSGCLFGLIGGGASWARKNYLPGCVGIISRSGGLSQLLGAFHCRPHLPGPLPGGGYGELWGGTGPGVSAVICVGGDPVPGTTMLEAALAFEADPRTKVVAGYGETGTLQENELAEAVAGGRITKPVVLFLGGRFTEAGVSQSHAGAMIRCEAETWAAKREALLSAGVTVVDRPDAVFGSVAGVLGLV